jgi:hypothetical protein
MAARRRQCGHIGSKHGLEKSCLWSEFPAFPVNPRINLVETRRENGSFGSGLASFAN